MSERYERLWIAFDSAGNPFAVAETPDQICSTVRPKVEYCTVQQLQSVTAAKEKAEAHLKLFDQVIDEEHIAESCINPLEDLKIAIRKLKAQLTASRTECEGLRKALDEIVEEVVAQANVCMSHVGIMPRQQDWVRNEMRVYGNGLVARALASSQHQQSVKE